MEEELEQMMAIGRAVNEWVLERKIETYRSLSQENQRHVRSICKSWGAPFPLYGNKVYQEVLGFKLFYN